VADLKAELKKMLAQRGRPSGKPARTEPQREKDPGNEAGGSASLRNPVKLYQPVMPVIAARVHAVRLPHVAPSPAVPVPRVPAPVPTSFTPLARTALVRQGLYRDPADWVTLGVGTQTEAASAARHVDIVIGLDFGTSYTKAAVGFMDKIYPVTWEGVSKGTPEFLLASEYTVGPQGVGMLGQHPASSLGELVGDLKLPFINPGVSQHSIARAAIFLGLVIGYIRAWVFRYHGMKLGEARIRWQLNLGAPCNGMESERLVAAYRRLADTAWVLSLLPKGGRIADAEVLAEQWQEGQPITDLVGRTICPEFVAQMAGYMASPQRVRGLHALIDVGGGTVDIVTFNVHSVGDEDTFPFLVPEVRPLGTHALVQNRLVGVTAPVGVCIPDELDPVAEVEQFSIRTGIDAGHVRDRDALFSQTLVKRVRSVFEMTKAHRYRMSDAWSTGVRTFFTGGGSGVALYGDAIASVRTSGACGLLIRPLPLHPKLDGIPLDIAEYQRVSVACGLAQDSFTLARIVAAREVEDDTPAMLKLGVRPDKDDFYT